MIPSSKPVRGPWRVVRRMQQAAVYHLLVRRALGRTDTTTMFGLVLDVPPTVFHPKFYRTTRCFGEYLSGIDLRGLSVLEMGCGSGALSLVAARAGARVTAADINPKAVEATLANARKNGLGSSLRACVSDLFECIPPEERFDAILWNPPFYPVEPAGDAAYAWNAGTGYRVLRRFAHAAAEFLRPEGKIITQVSTEIDAEKVLDFYREEQLTPRLAAVRKLPFETLSMYEILPGPR